MNSILFTASTFSHIQNFHRPYLNAFHDLGWRVDVACGGEILPIPEADHAYALPFEKKMTSPKNLTAQKKLRTLMEENRYTLICTHTSLAAFFTRRAAAGLAKRPPIVNVVHGYLFDDETPALKKAVLLTAEKLTAPQTDLLLTMNSWDHRKAAAEKLGRRIVNIPGIGVDLTRFDATSDADGQVLRAELGLEPEDFILVYAAEFSKRKNQAMLIRSLPLLPQYVKLVLPGEGSLLSDCKVLAQSLQVSDRVFFPGQRNDMPRILRGCDAACSASRSEGLPFNIMEAMSCSLPVVASAVKGHTDLIADGETGLLYPYGDEASFVRQVQRLLDTPILAQKFGAAAHDAVCPYTLEHVLPEVMQQYLSVVSI